jgi:hypothetical protein
VSVAITLVTVPQRVYGYRVKEENVTMVVEGFQNKLTEFFFKYFVVRINVFIFSLACYV